MGCPISWDTALLHLALPFPGSKGSIPGLYPRLVSQACIYAACLVHRAQLLHPFCPGFSLLKSDFPASLLCSPFAVPSSSPGTDTGDSSPDFDDKFRFHGIKIPKQRLKLTEVITQSVQISVGPKHFAAHSQSL